MGSTVNVLKNLIKSEDDSTVLSALEVFGEVVRGGEWDGVVAWGSRTCCFLGDSFLRATVKSSS